MSSSVEQAATERAAYVHVPFCHRRCPYCDFAVVDMERESSPVARYVDAIVAEIGMAESWGPLHAVNLGGGTPSILSALMVGRILDALRHQFGITDDAEVSIEANPEDITARQANELVAVGINRMSLGVQSFDDRVLSLLGRSHTAAEAAAAVANARNAGVTTTNLDLILGMPAESLDSWKRTVHTAVGLETEHISAYALTVELGTELSRSVAAGAPGPDPDDQADKYEVLQEALTLGHYEVSNWAQPGHECRYNLTTWAQGEYDAFGMGAHGHRNGIRTRNYRRLDLYLDLVERGERPVQGSEQLDEWRREKERLFLGLRLRSGIRCGPAGEALLATEVGERFVDAGVIARLGERLVVQRPLLTDAVAREVLGLNQPL